MTHIPDDEDRLARLMDAALRDLEPRRAPATLESRVLAQIAQRRAAPWMLRSFGHWPRVAQALFLAASFALIGIILAGIPGLPSGDWLRPVTAAAAALQSLAGSLSSAMAVADAGPAIGLKIFLAAAAGLYAALFGLGATAYRLLYLRPRAAAP